MHRTSKTTFLLVPLLFSIALSLPYLENEDFENIGLENVPDSNDFSYPKNVLGRRSLSADPKYGVSRRIPAYNFGLGKRSKIENGLVNEPDLMQIEKIYEDLYQGRTFVAYI